MNRLLLLSVFVIFVTQLSVAVPQQINYQGYLTRTDGSPLDTTVAITFKLFGDSVGSATLLWTESRPSITAQGGLFNVRLGQVTPLPDAVFNATQVWLGVTVGNNSEMTPRVRLVSVGYSYRVGTVDGASGGSVSGKINVGMGNSNPGAYANVHGQSNAASGDHSVVAGGVNNYARGAYSIIAGGGGTLPNDSNSAFGEKCTIGGGEGNLAGGSCAFIGGGRRNTTSGVGTIAGGQDNIASNYSFVGGGINNQAIGGDARTVAGGWGNQATGQGSFIGGGSGNRASGVFSAVSGGGGYEPSDSNAAGGDYSFVGGGRGNQATGDSSVICGGADNHASGLGATISGGKGNLAAGQNATVGGGGFNKARANYSVISGGGGSAAVDSNSVSGSYSFIGGGYSNTVNGSASTVGGGIHNLCNGTYACIPGGNNNRANGNYSFAGGLRSRANHQGAFVWGATSSDWDTTASFNLYTFTVRCQNGARFYTASSGTATGVQLSAGGGSWSSLCDARQKNLYGEVVTSEVLQKISSLPLHRWSYKTQDESIQHIGPTAQDFRAAFGLGESDTTINTLDPDGIALAAIQELAKQNAELRTAVRGYRNELSELRSQIQSLLAKDGQTQLREEK